MPSTGYNPEYDFNPERPAGATDTVSLIDNWVNSNNQHFDNAYGVEHYAPSQDADASTDHYGRHDFITLIEKGAKPDLTSSTTRHAVYAKAAGIYIEQDDGTEYKILDFTTGRSGLPADVPTGERIIFYKNTAVTGYTLVTTADDYLVYIGSGSVAGGLTGAAVRSGGTWTQPNHTHSVTATGTTATPSGTAQDQGDGTNSCAVSDHTHTVSVTGTSGNGATANTWRPTGLVFTLQQRA